jgi:hypothetical protein
MQRLMVFLATGAVVWLSVAGVPAAQRGPDDDVSLMDVLLNFVSAGNYSPPDDSDPPFSRVPYDPTPTPPSGPDSPPSDATFANAPNEVPQDENVVPIAGDSSGDVDEVMLERPGLHLIAYVPPAAVAPVAVLSGLHDGDVQLRVFSASGVTAAERARLMRTPLVIRPLSAVEKARTERWIASAAVPGSGLHLTRIPMRAYCVEAKKAAPSADTLFVVAPAAEQARFAPAAAVRVAAEFAASRGFLKPQGDAAAYGRFITQYAIWTRLEHWDAARFSDEFVSRTKQRYLAAGKPWTRETEQTLRVLGPARWHDVQIVIRAATRLEGMPRNPKGVRQ